MDFSHLSRTKLRRLITEINDDFSKVFKNEKTMIIQDKNYDYFVKSEDTPNEVFHRLKLYYLKNSIHFEVLRLLMTSPTKWSVLDLSDTFSVSASYLYQIVREINEVLQDFSITLAKVDEVHFELQGAEKDIRLFSFLLLSESYLSIESPFEKEEPSINGFVDLLPLSAAEKERAYYLYMICTQRMTEGHVLDDFPVEISELLSYFHLPKELADFEADILSQYTEDQAVVQRESWFIHLLMRVVIYNDKNTEKKMLVGKQFMLIDNVITNYCRQLFAQLIETFEIVISEAYFYEALYYLVIVHMFLYLFPIDLEEAISLNYETTAIGGVHQEIRLERMVDFYKKFFSSQLSEKNGQLFHKYSEQHMVYLAKQLLILLDIFTPQPLHVFIHYSQNVLGNMLVKKKTRHMFSEKMLVVTQDVMEADVVISDCVEYEDENLDYFFLYDLSSETIWEKLYEFIQEKIMKNLFDAEFHSKMSTDFLVKD